MKKTTLLLYKIVSWLVVLAVIVRLLKIQWRNYCVNHGVAWSYINFLYILLFPVVTTMVWIITFTAMAAINDEALQRNRLLTGLVCSSLAICIVALLFDNQMDYDF